MNFFIFCVWSADFVLFCCCQFSALILNRKKIDKMIWSNSKRWNVAREYFLSLGFVCSAKRDKMADLAMFAIKALGLPLFALFSYKSICAKKKKKHILTLSYSVLCVRLSGWLPKRLLIAFLSRISQQVKLLSYSLSVCKQNRGKPLLRLLLSFSNKARLKAMLLSPFLLLKRETEETIAKMQLQY